MKKYGLLLAIAMFIGFTACEEEEEYVLVNGNYEAESAEFGHGWKAFMKAEIKNDKMETVDFDYFNADGDLKSETTTETYPMDPHPTVWLPQMEAQLLAADLLNFTEIDGITGATGASGDAQAMLELIIEAARTGDTSKQILTEE
jgi:major membrane immunogen (membrane-anchored lipoprotein)